MNNIIIKSLYKKFNNINVLSDLSITINENKVYSIIGPNGSGKTTLLNCISGIYKPDVGTIFYNNNDLTRLNIFQISNLGIKRTYQNIRLSNKMTVAENIYIGDYAYINQNIFDVIFKTKKYCLNEKKTWQKVVALAEKFKLTKVLYEPVSNLDYGTKKKVEILRALISCPNILILDEPAAGLNDAEKNELTSILLEIKSNSNLIIILIEHDLQMIKNISDEIFVLHNGQKIAHGDFNEIMANQEVIEAYIGGSYA